MKLGGIEVSGIENVVFYERYNLIRRYHEIYGIIWCKENREYEYILHNQMIKQLHSVVVDERFRIWVSGNTINVVVKDE